MFKGGESGVDKEYETIVNTDEGILLSDSVDDQWEGVLD